MIDAPGGPFWWPEANEAFRETIKQHLRADIPVLELDVNVNDPLFARSAAENLLELIGARKLG